MDMSLHIAKGDFADVIQDLETEEIILGLGLAQCNQSVLIKQRQEVQSEQ